MAPPKDYSKPDPDNKNVYYSVYDAIAGRVINRNYRELNEFGQNWEAESFRTTDPRLPPDEILFRRTNAPPRYEEEDFYPAHQNLPEGALPPSELLRSVHKYASSYYEAMAKRVGPEGMMGERTIDEKSMDETALLAFGILLEEAGREVVKGKGDLVFTEADMGEEKKRDKRKDVPLVIRRKRTGFVKTESFKRRKLGKAKRVSRDEHDHDDDGGE